MATETSVLLRELAAKRGEFLAFVERRVNDRALAEDILQDAFIKSAEKLGELRTPEAATAWFYRVLRNASIESHRRDDRRARALSAAEIEAANAAREPAFDELAAGCHCVGELVETLDPKYAEALARIEVDGVAVKDFAAERGITANNAAVRVHRARRALAREVAACCGACASLGCADCTCDS
ncbi:MAG: sigma-70 family RNA polymerase sigma factor [Myxococcales bacterium]|nr:sigma-70 family RNA polymerase sigma factor [Myxococcales bacterium]